MPLATGVPAEDKNPRDFRIMPAAWQTPRAMSSTAWADFIVGKE